MRHFLPVFLSLNTLFSKALLQNSSSWASVFDSCHNQKDREAISIIQLKNGVVVVAVTEYYPKDGEIVLTYNETGGLLSNTRLDTGYSSKTILAKNDNGTYLTLSSKNMYDIIVTKWGKDNELLWSVLISDSICSLTPYSIVSLPDGNFVIAAYACGRILVAQYNSEAIFLWRTDFSLESSYLYQPSMTVSADKQSILIMSYTSSYQQVLIQSDLEGKQQWAKFSIGNTNIQPKKMSLTHDGGYIVTGISGLTYDNSIFIMKLDKNGKVAWGKTIFGEASYYGYSVAELLDGRVVIVGIIYSSSYSSCIAVLDETGNLLFAYQLRGGKYNGAYDVAATQDGGFVISGYFSKVSWYNKMMTIKFNQKIEFDEKVTPSGGEWVDITHMTYQIDNPFILKEANVSSTQSFSLWLNKTEIQNSIISSVCNHSNNSLINVFQLIIISSILFILGLIGYFGRNPERKKMQKTEEKSPQISLSTKNQSLFFQENPEINPAVTLATEPNVISV